MPTRVNPRSPKGATMGYRVQPLFVVSVVLALVVSACAASPSGPGGASTSVPGSAASAEKGTGTVVFVGGGGITQDAMNDAFLKPFSDKFGVTIKQGSDISLARAKAAVDSGHPDFDVATVNQADYLVGLADGLWAPINYSY